MHEGVSVLDLILHIGGKTSIEIKYWYMHDPWLAAHPRRRFVWAASHQKAKGNIILIFIPRPSVPASSK